MTNNSRYEVTAPMPHFTHLFKGDILVPKHHALCGDCWGKEDEEDVSKWVTFCPDYPHLFRLLKWWEHVPVDELPKYVNHNGIVRRLKHFLPKAEYFCLWDNKGEINYIESKKSLDGTGYELYYADDCEPSTESEYTDYLTKLNAK